MFCVKVHELDGEVVVAACDAEILGKVFSDGELEVNVGHGFYGGDRMGVEGLIGEIGSGTIVNVLGNRVVDALVEEGVIGKDSIVELCGLKHAQIVNMRE
ncbi:MAG: DUF424 family protein [Candidatus Altiarchaeota archaeon]